jgi:hypothetical protein
VDKPKKNTEKLGPFGTLEKKNNICYDDRWSPTSVPAFEEILSQGMLTNMKKELRKNIAYSLQYMQFLELQIKELTLHGVVKKMVYKNYIVTGVSIIEGVFYHLLKSNGAWRQKEWELINIVKSNEYTENGKRLKMESQIYKKIDPVDDEMNLDSIIKKMESKSIINLKHGAYPYIKKLKRLRNKVHLIINEHPDDTDWNNFQDIDYFWMKYTLYNVLIDEAFENSKGKFIEFLYPNEEEFVCLKKDVKKE